MARTRKAKAPRDPSATMVRHGTDPASRTTHMFDCPVARCGWSGSLAKVQPQVVLDPTATPTQDQIDDLLVAVMQVAGHLRSEHSALLPGERAATNAAPPAAGGGG